MNKPEGKITEEHENPDNISVAESMESYDSSKLIDFHESGIICFRPDNFEV